MSIGIIVAGHGQMAAGLLSALQALHQQHDCICALDLQKEEEQEEFYLRLKEAVDSLNCKKVLCLVDLAGSVVFNTASRFASEDFALIAGVNLGMLIEVDTVRQFSNNLSELADLALLIGKEQILALESV